MDVTWTSPVWGANRRLNGHRLLNSLSLTGLSVHSACQHAWGLTGEPPSDFWATCELPCMLTGSVCNYSPQQQCNPPANPHALLPSPTQTCPPTPPSPPTPPPRARIPLLPPDPHPPRPPLSQDKPGVRSVTPPPSSRTPLPRTAFINESVC
jgi:hypothetical protein